MGHKKNVILTFFSTLFCVVAVSTQAAPGNTVLGELRAQDTVTIKSNGSQVHITDNVYAYFGGDQVLTGEGGAAIDLGNDGAVYVGPGSVASIEKTGGAYVVNLDKGGIRFAFDQAVLFRIVAAGKVVESTGFRQVADQKSVRTGGVVVLEDGNPVVYATAGGNLVVRNPATSQYQTLKVGESVAVDQQTGNFIKVVRPGGAPEEDKDRRKLLLWLLGGGVAAGVIYHNVIHDHDASP